MKLFIILICIGLQHQLDFSPRRAQAWLKTYSFSIGKLLHSWQAKDSMLAVALRLLPLVISVAVLQWVVQNSLFGALNFLLQITVLFFCIQASNLKKRLADYFQALNNADEQAAFHHGLAFLPQTVAPDLVSLSRAITESIFRRADVGIFSVLFWYLMLGPVGAVIYASTRFWASEPNLVEPAAEKTAFSASAQQLHALLDWIPARLTALSYALAGHFGYALIPLRQQFLSKTLSSAHDLPLKTGLAALECSQNDRVLADGEENQKALTLVERSLLLWIAIIALFTLAAWVA